MPEIAGPDVDVLVIGAGPVGLALACHLRRLDLSVEIVEARAAASEHSKAIGLQYRVSEILARLGVIDRFLAEGGSPTTVNIYSDRRRLLSLRFRPPAGVSGPGAFQPTAILLPQSRTEALLPGELARSATPIQWNTEYLDCEQDAAGVRTRLRASGGHVREVRSRWLVSCEGAHSRVRKQAGITFSGRTYPLSFVMADVAIETELPHDENHVWLHQAGSLAALPLPAAGTWRLFVETTRNAADAPALDVAAIEATMAERARDFRGRIVGDPIWISDFRINCRMVDRMRAGRLFLAGDAAHIHSPTGGQGITTGLQDAANLAWKLARVCRGAPDRLLDTYGEERLPHAAEVLRETNRTTTVFFAPSVWARLVRDWVVLPILQRPSVQRRMFGKLSQLHTHHRGSSLSVDRIRGRRRSIRAGDRAPDVVWETTQGTRTSLFELMRSLRPVLLFAGLPNPGGIRGILSSLGVDAYEIGRPTSTVPRDRCLRDSTGYFAAHYRLGPSFCCLIRPDGHVGLVAIPAEWAALAGYLKLICDPILVPDAVDRVPA